MYVQIPYIGDRTAVLKQPNEETRCRGTAADRRTVRRQAATFGQHPLPDERPHADTPTVKHRLRCAVQGLRSDLRWQDRTAVRTADDRTWSTKGHVR